VIDVGRGVQGIGIKHALRLNPNVPAQHTLTHGFGRMQPRNGHVVFRTEAWAGRVVRLSATAQARGRQEYHAHVSSRSPDLHFGWLQQERLRDAEAHRLGDLARQFAKAQRAGVGESERKDQDP
jgi:hypothetical protein